MAWAGLLEARRVLLAAGLWIWLTGMSNPVRRVLQFSAMSDLFRIAGTTSEAIQYTRSAFAGQREPVGKHTMGKPVIASQVARAS